MASSISKFFPIDQTTTLYSRARHHLTRVSQQIAAFLMKKGMSEQHALPISKFATLLVIINFPFAITVLALFTFIFTSFASGAFAVFLAVLLSLAIVLSIAFFFLSLVMFGACAFTLLSTMFLVSVTCCALSMYGLALSFKGPNLFKPTWRPFKQFTQSDTTSEHQVDTPTDPAAGITTPTKHSPTSSFDQDIKEDSTIASDCSGSAE